ncbi:hypothetical protein ACLGL1_09415 [Peptococcus simiae]|uniref:hypothetical protein n=1 Tax=Peptococcus simiae TaxID=1643805 RepID=UPI0039804694
MQIIAQAAEQLYKTGGIQSRKKYVLNQLERQGIRIDGLSLDAAIEAAVHKINTEQKPAVIKREKERPAVTIKKGVIPDRQVDGRTGEVLK